MASDHHVGVGRVVVAPDNLGAPIGTAQALAVLLNGKAPPVNECRE